MSDLLEQARELAHYFETSRWSVKPERDAAATLRALVARVEAAERDAERYRWVRLHSYVEVRCNSPRAEGWSPDQLDAAIDEARKQG